MGKKIQSSNLNLYHVFLQLLFISSALFLAVILNGCKNNDNDEKNDPNQQAISALSATQATRSPWRIPNNLLFTYKFPLVEVYGLEQHNLATGVPASAGFKAVDGLKGTDHYLASNVLKTIDMYRHASTTNGNALQQVPMVYFLDNNDCMKLLEYSGQKNLLYVFKYERAGMYKGDICRAAMLWRYGGFYFDVDLEARSPIYPLLNRDSQFTSVREISMRGKWLNYGPGAFFQAFIATPPRHPVMNFTFDAMLAWYRTRKEHAVQAGALTRMEDPTDPFITRDRTSVLHHNQQMGTEAYWWAFTRWFSEYNPNPKSILLFDEAHLSFASNWAENSASPYRSHPDAAMRAVLSSVPRRQGVGEGCNYVVWDRQTLSVPFYSRCVGTGMCRQPGPPQVHAPNPGGGYNNQGTPQYQNAQSPLPQHNSPATAHIMKHYVSKKTQNEFEKAAYFMPPEKISDEQTERRFQYHRKKLSKTHKRQRHRKKKKGWILKSGSSPLDDMWSN
eukprot:gene624-338_t